MPAAPTGSVPASLALARVFFHLFRFRTLPNANALLARRSGPIPVHLFGGRLTLDPSRSSTHRLLLLVGERMLPERFLLRQLVRPGDTAVDVGANIGYVTLLLAQTVGPGGNVHAFEPDPDNLLELERTVAQNRLPNVRVHPCAVGDAEGVASLASGINARLRTEGTVPVRVRRLDDVLRGQRVDFLKIDVEGHEGAVLAGATRLLAEQRPRLFVEVHPWLAADPDGWSALWTAVLAYPSFAAFEPAPEGDPVAMIRARYGTSPIARLPWAAPPDRAAVAARTAAFWIAAPDPDTPA